MYVQKASTFASVFVLAFMLAGGFFVKVEKPTIYNMLYINQSMELDILERFFSINYNATKIQPMESD